MWQAYKPYVIGGASLIFGIAVGIALDASLLDVSLPIGASKNTCLSNLTFINPQPGCEIFEEKLERMKVLQDDLRRQLNGYLASGRADRISVFARDLTSQRFASVNDSDTFFMASLLKVPLAIAYYRLSEITPDLLSQTVTYTGTPNLYASQTTQPQDKLVIGKTYSINDLIYKALANSDNTAAQVLSESYVSFDYLQKILLALGLQVMKDGSSEDIVTVKSYAGMLRILYNSSFLTRKSSNEILSILSKSSFSDGATANLPKDIVVAHKFGERSIIDSRTGQSDSRQLHDCGIVYANKGQEPYIFCIMTEGNNFEDLKAILRDVSSTIYKGIIE